MHQVGTPWMDGVGLISHCPINPGSNFSYNFNATPSGTFWYHSHTGTQRTDGLFGALIVKERKNDWKIELLEELSGAGITRIVDSPEEHTISLLDWQREATQDLFTRLEGSLGFFPGHNSVIGEIQESLNMETRSWRTYAPDGSEVGPIPYWSGLINGKGVHQEMNQQLNKVQLSVVKLGEGQEPSTAYRFRLIGAQSLFAYRFSIDEHKLIVIATDGYFVKPKEVDFIIVHSGERYDFLLRSKESDSKLNYWVRAETLEDQTATNKRNGGPTDMHLAEAVLHYGTQDVIPSQYQAIKSASKAVIDGCTEESWCTALNCPFKSYPASRYNINCTDISELELLFQTKANELPNEDGREKVTHFFHFGFLGVSTSSAINGRNFLNPSAPPQLQPDQLQTCPDVDCESKEYECICTNVVKIDKKNITVEMVFSADKDFAHPVHLHGHSFHVVGYEFGSYDDDGTVIDTIHPDVYCGGDAKCQSPTWRNGFNKEFRASGTTVRKDTVMVPAGGYVVIRFITDNPGYWFLHCHIESHQLEGMAVLINEVESEHPTPPENLTRCGNYYTPNGTPDPTSDSCVAVTGSVGYLLLFVVAYLLLN